MQRDLLDHTSSPTQSFLQETQKLPVWFVGNAGRHIYCTLPEFFSLTLFITVRRKLAFVNWKSRSSNREIVPATLTCDFKCTLRRRQYVNTMYRLWNKLSTLFNKFTTPSLSHGTEIPYFKSNVYWTVHHCNSWGMKNQLDVTCYFISLIMRSTCFGH